MGVINRIARLFNRDSALVVENTGEVTETDGGTAVTGYSGPPLRPGQNIVVKNTGNATAIGSNSRSNSGIDLT